MVARAPRFGQLTEVNFKTNAAGAFIVSGGTVRLLRTPKAIGHSHRGVRNPWLAVFVKSALRCERVPRSEDYACPSVCQIHSGRLRLDTIISGPHAPTKYWNITQGIGSTAERDFPKTHLIIQGASHKCSAVGRQDPFCLSSLDKRYVVARARHGAVS